ncbi:hypothetical protein BSKO_07069 [Bryopsis sp. KO-2023]|nr:hypothetical protein BSKO_07069 [Bryopsis sp. KO-2023]
MASSARAAHGLEKVIHHPIHTITVSVVGPGVCLNPECEGLHRTVEHHMEQKSWSQPADSQPRLIISAGPERSGSTWLFNAIRLLFKHAKVPLDSFWIHNVTDAKLKARGVGRRNILIKTHHWSDDWDVSQATDIAVMHRDLRGVLSSYMRLGWANSIPDSYVSEHFKWAAVCHVDIAFEDLARDGAGRLALLAQRLDLLSKVDIDLVNEELNSLRPPEGTHLLDQNTKLWPKHLSPSVIKAMGGGGCVEGEFGTTVKDGAQLERLKDRFPQYFEVYGYT